MMTKKEIIKILRKLEKSFVKSTTQEITYGYRLALIHVEDQINRVKEKKQ